MSVGSILVERFGAPNDRRTRSQGRVTTHAHSCMQSLGSQNLQGKTSPNFSKIDTNNLRRLNKTTD
eukprot:6144446-Pleurochrysis_carterae.AAC.1